MKLLCATIAILLGFSNGSVLQSFYNLGVGLSAPQHSTFPHGYGIASNVPLTTYEYEIPCPFYITDEILANFRVHVFKFMTDSLRKAVSDGNLAYSPYTAWLSLAAIAEGTEGSTREELFKVLSLPEDRCLRQIYYRLATTREFPSNDVVLGRRRLFITDTSVNVNKNWEVFARWHTHLNTVSVPFKSNSSEIENLKRVFKLQLSNINMDGNSLLLESLDYYGLWSSAFADAKIETGPFYNTNGEEIGTMEFLKITRQVNIGYAKSSNLKIIEIPVGRDGRYKMFFALSLEKDQTKAVKGFRDDLVFESLANMRPSPGAIEITIPRFSITSEVDLRKILEEMGVTSLWTDPLGTRNISNPAALPSAFIQRVTVSLDNTGVSPPVQDNNIIVPWPSDEIFTHYAQNPAIFKDFVANRPFLVGLFDSELYTLLFAVAFSKPDA